MPRARSRSSHRFGYPRPQLGRENWSDLNGRWQFALDAEARWSVPQHVRWDATIEVPFAPETPASRIGETGFFKASWYRRSFEPPRLTKSQRLILHFGAVDHVASVWVNDRLAAVHEGGYTPFSADITDLLTAARRQTIVVRAFDDPDDMEKPRGKQDWELRPHSIWYYRTSGIWQPVWMEVVPAVHIAALKWSANVERWEIEISARLVGVARAGARLAVRLRYDDQVLADDVYAVEHGRATRVIRLRDPGIGDHRSQLLWTPDSPRLIDAELELHDHRGRLLDRVESYTAMRSVSCLGDRFMLNNSPFPLRMALNQGYWPQSRLTAPDDAAYRLDVELAKAMGFNGVRMHQKIESPRLLYWADRLGLMVWEEMPSAYSLSERSMRRLTREWAEALDRDASHPCIVALVPFNESWGLPDLPAVEAQRHALRAMYHLTKSLDSTRPVIGNDGWEMADTDVFAIHDYERDPARLSQRYACSEAQIAHLLRHERPGHRILTLDGFPYRGQPIMLTEFGGIAYSKDDAGTWGYSRARSPQDLAGRYARLLHAVRSLPLLAGFCYTQFTDTYQEANGLLYMDRTPKFPLEQIAVATRGPQNEAEARVLEGMIQTE